MWSQISLWFGDAHSDQERKLSEQSQNEIRGHQFRLGIQGARDWPDEPKMGFGGPAPLAGDPFEYSQNIDDEFTSPLTAREKAVLNIACKSIIVDSWTSMPGLLCDQ